MNNALREYLEYYTNLELEPRYAVLIDGDWGSGKTWFIKNFFEEKAKPESIYITLYGVNKLQNIDEQFFQQLHPVLSSKGMMIAGKVLKGLAKGVLKIDFDAEGDVQGEVNVGMPDLNLPHYLQNTEDQVIIFDDLERADLKPEILLGYINQFVEHNGQKVIIIANEKEIDNSDSYRRIKEKVIGRSFSIESSFDEPFDNFVQIIRDESLEDILEENKDSIKTIFKSSDSNNLRHLRHGLTEFERLYQGIKEICEECCENEVLITDLIEFYFSIFIEINRGDLSTEKLKNFRTQIFSDFIRNSQEQDSEIVEMVRRYPTVTFDNMVLNEKFWFDFFEKGTINGKQIEQLKKSSKYFEEERPLWLKLWNHFYLTNNELEEVISDVEELFENNSFSNFGELAHITGSLMKLSEAGIYNQSKNDIYDDSKNQLNNLFDESQIQLGLKEDHHNLTRDHNMGYQYQGSGISDFEKFLNCFETKYQSEKEKLIKSKADELLELLIDNTKKFTSLISIHSAENYHLYSIISKFDQDKFLDQFKNLRPEQRRDVILSFSNRISNRSLNAEETVWIEEIIKKLKSQFPASDNTIESYNVNKGIEKLESGLSN